MSEKSPGTLITTEELEAIAGGSCTPQEYLDILGRLGQSYETLIQFTSYVIERVAESYK